MNSTWTNEHNVGLEISKSKRKTWQFLLAGLLLLAAVAFVVYNAIISNGGTQLYLTVAEFYAQESEIQDKNLRVSGWVIGESIVFEQIDANTSKLEFDIVDDLSNPTQTLRVVAWNEAKPDLLQHEAQALVEGTSGGSGEFVATPGGLLLKCPTRYEEVETAALE